MFDLKGKKLLVFGDSIINGSGNNNFGVGEYLERDYGVKLYKYCIGGARVGFVEGKSWVVEQVRKIIDDGVQPDIILFDGFTNDCLGDVPLGEMSSGFDNFDIFKVGKENTNFSNCFENVLSALKKYLPNAKAMFIRPHRMGRRGEKEQILYGERAVELCKKWGVAVCDLYELSGLDTFLPEHRDKYTNDSYGLGMGDCTPPNAAGYEEKYMPVIEKAIKNL